MDWVEAQIEYLNENKYDFDIQKIIFCGPSDMMTILLETIGFNGI